MSMVVKEITPPKVLPPDLLLEETHVKGGPVDPLSKFATVVRIIYQKEESASKAKQK